VRRVEAAWRASQAEYRTAPDDLLAGEYGRTRVSEGVALIAQGVKVRVQADDGEVGITYRGDEAVVFDLVTGLELHRERAQPPTEARTYPSSHADFPTDGQLLQDTAPTRLRGQTLVYDADFGTLELRLIDPLLPDPGTLPTGCGEPLESAECRQLMREHPDYLEPAFVVFALSAGTEAEPEAMRLLADCSEQPTARARYVTSIINAALQRQRWRRPRAATV